MSWTQDEVQQSLVRRLAEELNLDPAVIGPDDLFSDHGLDSIAAASVAVGLERWLGVELPTTVLWDHPSVSALTRYLMGVLARGDAPSAWSGQVQPPRAVLERDASFELKTPGPRSRVPGGPLKEVLLTGATGFFGLHLIDALTRRTDAHLHCLVRGKTQLEREARLRGQLERYQLWRPELASRLSVVAGDLERQNLGLEPAVRARLLSRLDAVLHSGAVLNHTLPYDELRAANVTATREVLELAAQSDHAAVHHVSTVAVFGSLSYRGQRAMEADRLAFGREPRVGYLLSKWTAERAVTTAREQGLPATIYRVGLLGGASGTGLSNPDDILGRFLRACIELGVAPRLTCHMDLAPVDVIADQLVYLAQRPEASGRIFHLTHPAPVPFAELVRGIRAFGYPLDEVEYETWKQEVVRRVGADRKSPLYPLFRLLALGPVPEAELSTFELFLGGRFPAFDVSEALAELTGSGLVCPPIDGRFVAAFLEGFCAQGLLPRPESSGRSKLSGGA